MKIYPSKISYLLSLITISIIVIFSHSCNRNNNNDGKLTFSIKQVTFDTVFTSLGSAYKTLVVKNLNNYDIKTCIELGGSNHSFFSLNVDGISGNNFKNVLIRSNDSIFIFIKVTINPQHQDNPLLITDSITFYTSNNKQSINLLAYGQDANFIIGDTEYVQGIKYKVIAGCHETTHWTADRPYVIFGWAVVDSLGSLVIDPGTRIYLHSNSRLWVYRDGHIEVNGTADNPVYFKCDNEINSYINTIDDASWDRIWICEGNQDNIIDNAIISKAFVGIQIEPFQQDIVALNKTVIKNTVVKRTINAGIIGKRTNLDITSCVIADNGSGSIILNIGNFILKHNTIGNYFGGTPNRKNPALCVSNIISDSNPVLAGNTNFYCVNSIIYGNLASEFLADGSQEASLIWLLENCLIKSEKTFNNAINCIYNTYPIFKNVITKNLDLRVSSGSPAIGSGKTGAGINTDITGQPFLTPPTIGAYEYYE